MKDDILSNVYYRAQENIWNGKEILSQLLKKNNDTLLLRKDSSGADDRAKSFLKIIDLLIDGERAAWNVSADLTNVVDDVSAKLALTSQAHDESRHATTLILYKEKFVADNASLEFIESNPHSIRLLTEISKADSIEKKLLGIHLMIEPVAIVIFKSLKENNIEPVLTELLPYFEADEGRHIVIGINYLPPLIKEMSHPEKLDLLFWQLRMLFFEVQALKELEKDFEALGFTSEQVFRLAEKKQLEVLNMLADELGISQKIWEPIRKAVELYKNHLFRGEDINYLNLATTTIYSKINQLLYPNNE